MINVLSLFVYSNGSMEFGGFSHKLSAREETEEVPSMQSRKSSLGTDWNQSRRAVEMSERAASKESSGKGATGDGIELHARTSAHQILTPLLAYIPAQLAQVRHRT